MSTAPDGYQAPKTNWQAADAPGPADVNRIEGNISAIEGGSRTVDPAQAPASNEGTLRQLLDWLTNRIKAVTGAANWWDAPATTLAAAKTHQDAATAHSATSAPTASRIMMRDGNGRAQVAAPVVAADIARLDTVTAHSGAGADAHPATAISYTPAGNIVASNVQAAINELDGEKVARAGDTLTGPYTQDQAAPAAGQVQPYWTLKQGGADRIRYGMDDAGNLVVQRWTGADWATVMTFQVAASLVLGNIDQVDGYHFRVSAGVMEYSSDGNTWAPAGLPPAQIRRIARLY